MFFLVENCLLEYAIGRLFIMQCTLLLLNIRSVSQNAPPYTFQNVKVKRLIDSLLRMNKFIIDDSFGIEKADPGRRNFVIRKKGVAFINSYKFGMFISCSRSSPLHQKTIISLVPLRVYISQPRIRFVMHLVPLPC